MSSGTITITRVGTILNILKMVNTDFLLNVNSTVDIMATREALTLLVRHDKSNYDIGEMPKPILVEHKVWKKLKGFALATVRLVGMGEKPDILVEDLDSGIRLRLEMSADYDRYVSIYNGLLRSKYKLIMGTTMPVSKLMRIKPFVKSTTDVTLTMGRHGGNIEFMETGVSITIDIPREQIVVYDENSDVEEDIIKLDPNIVAYIDRMSAMKRIEDVVLVLARDAEIDTGFNILLVLPPDTYGELVDVSELSAVIQARPVR